ncbi:sushi, von Willebrand factor type A, EGF and pentraxin domain-containing protein 1-like [Mercenaria mercenaria]|uniref:sushi, von Willebrand factor type A, EGF and pentraxin domain-containing protein 1-like n=1 Tax=Mercenaria mercenaria TaxID=6596 RepID=UPI00234F186E|nr:sushi, von Willebrand factor type A, EGF and pentraxin domain-containing protein 1-like [Mercenaria mercenaria]
MREINGTKYNSIANISCDAGYKEKNKTQIAGITSTLIRCNENGTWANQPTCVRKDCGDLNIDNAANKHLHNDTKYHSTATIDCDEGFYNKNQTQKAEISTTEISCSEYGTWVNIPTCIRKDCKPLSSPPNGNIAFEKNDTSYGSNATITCHDGYSVAGPDNIVCEKSGNWSNYTIQCQINDCGRLPQPTNGKIIFAQNMTTYGSNATYTCDDGYYINGSKTIHCEASGHWNTDEKRCQIRDCHTPTPVQDGFIGTPNGTEFGAMAIISCNPGYKLHGDNFTKCKANGKWSTYLVNCTLNECPTANDTDNGSVNRTDKSHAVYKCDTGYTLHGQERLFCQLNGTWSAKPPTCNIKDCGNLTSPEHGNVTLNNGLTTFKSTATFTCDTGYELTDKSISICNASGNWSTIPNCRIKDCGNVTTVPANGHVDQPNETTYLSVSKFRCDIGYTLQGDNSTVCTKDGRWRTYKVTCAINHCSKPTSPTNGNVSPVNGTTYRSIANYTCNEGFTLNGTSITTCESDKTWSGPLPTCDIKNCHTPSAPINGKVNTTNGTIYQSVATFSCDIGYTLNGGNSTVCESSGNWSEHNLKCVINDCGNLTAPGNGTVTFSNGTTYTSIAYYDCHTGFDLHGANETSCQANRAWDAQTPTCVIRDCGKPPKAPAIGTSTNNGTTYQAVVSYICNEGFDLIGNASAVCQENGTWSTGPTNCTIKDCGKPNGTAHGTFSPETGGHFFNDNATYKCDKGYETSDATFITCNSSGEWNRPPPICKDINECDRYTANCHRRADCNNTDGSYWCKCQSGFIDISGGKGTNCEDIDECSRASTNNCNKNGSQCINYPGGFLCLCDDGWTGDTCSIDIDECNTTGCGVRANCTNYDGGYNCTCISGYPKGDPKIHCYENVIIDLETRVDPFRGNDELIDAKPIHYRFPYYGYEYNSYRPNMNGFLTLGYQPVYEHYGPETPDDWKKYSRGNTVIAPFWTDIDSTNLTGGLYVHLFENYTNYGPNDSQHKDLSRLGNIFTEYYNLTNFTPRVAIVATWINVTQSSYIVPSRLIRTHNATMQVILISDGIYSYVMFNYDHEQWSFEIDKNIPSSAGYTKSDKTGYIIATRQNFTQLNKDTNVKEGPNYINGRWIYDVSSTNINRNAVLRNESECLKFSKNKTIKEWIAKQRELAYPCPCSEQQMQLDYSYRKVDPMYESSQTKTVCYEAWFFNNDGVKQTCCYSYGALKKENTGGGFATFEHDKYNTTQYFYKCCDATTDRHLCHLFYEMNPSDDCSRFQPADEPIGRYRRSLIGYMRSGTGKLYVVCNF